MDANLIVNVCWTCVGVVEEVNKGHRVTNVSDGYGRGRRRRRSGSNHLVTLDLIPSQQSRLRRNGIVSILLNEYTCT